MQTISRRRWLSWSATACGLSFVGCRVPGLGDPAILNSGVDPDAPSMLSGQSELERIAAAPLSSESGNTAAEGLSESVSATIWTNNFEDALLRADSEGKLILAFFTGSDFCPPCQRLRNEVVETAEFQTWAAPQFVLLELDYPRQTPQPRGLQEQNRELLQRYGVRSYPTVLILSAQGEVLGKAGYRPGGPVAWMRMIDAQLARS